MKIRTTINVILTVKNWQVYIKDYFNKTKGQNITYTLRNGLKIKTRARSTDRDIFSEVHLIKTYQQHKIQIRPSDIVFDIGAHIGTFTLLAAKKAKKVYSFEPVDENFSLLKENIKLNNLTNVKLINKAVTNKKETIPFYISKTSTGNHSVLKREDSTGQISVKTIALLDFIKTHNIKEIGLLKLDCEGSEYQILFSLPNKTFSMIRQVSMECHPHQNHKPIMLKELLEKQGFKVKMTSAEYPMIYAKRSK